MKILDKIVVHLFGTGAELTSGQKLYFKLFEAFAIYNSIDLAWSWAFYILKIKEVVLPLGIATYLDIGFMFGSELPMVLAGTLSILGILAFFRVGPRWLYLIAFLILHLLFCSRYCLGEIPHSANFVGLSLLALGLSTYLYEDNRHRASITMGLVYFFIGFGYTTASISKLIATGFHWVDGRHLWLWMSEKSIDHLSKYGAVEYNFLQELAFISMPIATLILIIGITTEFFGFLIWFRRTRPFITLAIIGMHIGIYLTMNIWFGKFMSELILIGFPWGIWIDRLNITQLNKWKFLET
ncbi:hypothetical protein SAMN04488029_1337 [Reichenbachiella faecimaris]|uniref:HTTM domain-containing protein n=1 Tax=Reichenbachiella faecimaris TaxID=692418 RepID=A0A1W2G9K3_REIFA|nr:hypothetical protein [Reichenbachiella faecimaris]SMD32976.1 hypothetical protein SAMN04488029_1337 [Reichenbachiella faecimaris]